MPETALDRFRRIAPHLAVAVYALDPGGAVTIELISADGSIARFSGADEAAVWEQILPGLTAPPPDDNEPEDDIFA